MWTVNTFWPYMVEASRRTIKIFHSLCTNISLYFCWKNLLYVLTDGILLYRIYRSHTFLNMVTLKGKQIFNEISKLISKPWQFRCVFIYVVLYCKKFQILGVFQTISTSSDNMKLSQWQVNSPWTSHHHLIKKFSFFFPVQMVSRYFPSPWDTTP